MEQWKKDVDSFLELADRYEIRMLMVGGAAVNFHGYQRHSADVDFWLDTTQENLNRLGKVFQEMGFDFTGFPKEVGERKQNISLKFSPADFDVELITNFNIGKTFNEAYQNSEKAQIENISVARYRVLSFEDLITSKVKSARAKDLLDVQELRRIKYKDQKSGEDPT